MMVGAIGTVAADPQVGTSGNCDDADGNNGGGAAILLSEDDQDLLTPGEVEGTVMGLAHLAQASAENQDVACEEGEADPNDPGNDYLEAHVDTGQPGGAAQVCIDETTTTTGGNPVLVGEDTDHDNDNPDRNCEHGQHQDDQQSVV